MLAKNIEVGGFYRAVVKNKTTTVEVLKEFTKGGWLVRDTKTGSRMQFKTAAKFKDKSSNPAKQKKLAIEPPVKEKADKKFAGKLSSRLNGKLRDQPAPKYAFPPTAEQQAILDMATKAERSDCRVIVVCAGAGTGKTASDVMLAQTLQGNGQYTAFNTNLVNEGKPKFATTRCACNTTHSLAFRAVGSAYSHRLNSSRIKSSQIAHMLGIHEDYEIPLSLGGEVKRLVPKLQAALVMGAIKRFCQSAEREVLPRHFRYVDGIDEPSPDGRKTYDNNEALREHLLPYAHKAWKDLSSIEGQLPFQHDHYVKIWQLGDPVIAADYILLDEAQDTAQVMLDILAQQIKPSRRVKPLIILVGDSAQQIYEWRGAIDALAAFPDAPRRYLSQSFRFGNAIAEVANLILAELREPTELRLKGLPTIPSRVVSNAPISDPTCVLCRTNAAAISTLLNSIAQGKHPFLVGGGSDVAAFVRSAMDLQEGRSTDHPELACFANWGEVQEYSQLEEGEDLKLMVKLIDEFKPKPILDALQTMPAEQDADLVISTAHKAKGREWDKVKLAADFPPRNKTGDAELKLLYVACTRAKLVLDVSECPFFQGEEGMSTFHIEMKQPSVSETAEFMQNQGSSHGISPTSEPRSVVTSNESRETVPVPPNMLAKPSIPVDKFTWARLQEGGWGIRGPKGYKGQSVTVERKDGTTSLIYLQESVWEDSSVSLYRVQS